MQYSQNAWLIELPVHKHTCLKDGENSDWNQGWTKGSRTREG